MSVTRILFAWDAEAFGGHDLTAFKAIERLANEPDLIIGVLHTGRNKSLANELNRLSSRLGRLEVLSAVVPTTPSESVDGIFRWRRTRAIEKYIHHWQPRFVVNIQGFITLGLCILAACRSLAIPVVSYLPMTHRIWTIRPSIVSLLQDLMNRFWYSVPSAYITISRRMKEILVNNHGVSADKVAVVECGPDVSTVPSGARDSARTALGWTGKRYVGVVGRVEFLQKRQDFLIHTIAAYRSVLKGYNFVIIGDGPDLDSAVRLVKQFDVENLVQFLPWQRSMSEIYPALDILLIPSRYEGVPLVMMEAMFRRIPVLASNVDGMMDLLPDECLFREGDAADLVKSLVALPKCLTPATLDRLSNYILNNRNETMFCESFSNEITRLCKH
ncbi:MAG: glycosyltransferase family 4 protein [Kiritimatiellae bacterium]|nr:glycosyltransferase family 4 protein [Kiritimatiellia bacterium]MDD5522675.1 glycosyltransferase family 4 protein [Kiritimatiellia bacterium]